MKIAQIAPLYEAVPPSLYGGTERIVAHLTNALVELGHEVTLFASAEAHTRATLVPVRDQAIRLDRFLLKSDLAAHLSMLHELHLRRHEFDLLHFHVDLIHFPFFEDLAARTVTTLQDRKSTRLNSSHTVISYAVFCLKKKRIKQRSTNKKIERITYV